MIFLKNFKLKIMKHIILLVSLILLGITAFRDSYKEQTYLADPINPLSLTCPEYLPTEHNFNANPNFAKPDAGMNNIDQNWYSAAVDNILNEEYNISYSEELKSYQSPNRANNIRFTYQNNGFMAKTMQAKIPLFEVNDKTIREADKKYKSIEDWKIELRIKNYEFGIKNEEVNVSGNKVSIENEMIRIDYTNTKEGMRQDFIIKEKPSGDDDLQLIMNVRTNLKMSVSKDKVAFRSKKDGTDKMHYSSLKAWDANGKILNAEFEKRNLKQFAIRIIDKDAQYPVTVDPISNTPDWTVDYRASAVSSAGDVNSDGYGDVIIGFSSFDNGRGKLFAYYGSESGLPEQADWTYEAMWGDSGYIELGFWVSCAGDVNNDGFEDIISSNSSTSLALWLFYGSESGLSSEPNWRYSELYGNSPYTTVSSAGDFNGDGYSDILVGSHQYQYQNEIGHVMIFLGTSSVPLHTPSHIFRNTDVYNRFGYSVSYAGDINMDGKSDVIIGIPCDRFSSDTGEVLIGYGTSSNTVSTLSLKGETGGDNFGFSVSGGDVNGDGYSDVAIGAPNFPIEGSSIKGKCYIYFGSPSGLSGTPNWRRYDLENKLGGSLNIEGDYNGDGFADLVVSTGDDWLVDSTSHVYVFFGNATLPAWQPSWNYELGTQESGGFVTSAGDPNGDGYDELIIKFNHQVLLFNGGYQRVSFHPDWALGYEYGNISISPAGDVNGDGFSDVICGRASDESAFLFYGSLSGISSTISWMVTAQGGFGSSVGTAGDINNDGFDDVIVGAPSFVNNNGSIGRVFMFLGSVNGLPSTPSSFVSSLAAEGSFGSFITSAGDVNNDGYSDILISANQFLNSNKIAAYVFGGTSSGIGNNNLLWTVSLPANSAPNGFGRSLSPGGDINGDNFDDILVSALELNDEATGGYAYAYYGRLNRQLFDSPDWSLFRDSTFGSTISDAGDINADGFGDILVSAIYQGQLNGRVYLFKGSATGPQNTPDWFTTGYWISSYGSSISNIGDFNNDGYDDIAIGEIHGFNPGTHIFLGSPNTLNPLEDISYQPGSTYISHGADFNGDNLSDFLSIMTYNDNRYGGFYGKNNSIRLTPKRFVHAGNEEHCSVSYLNFPGGKPASGFSVKFIVKGVNNDTIDIITDATGKASFCYSSTVWGIDTVIAVSAQVADTAIIIWDFPYPVELLAFNFSTKEKDVNLFWSTSTELNNSGFEIERANKNREWSKIGFVSGGGTTNEPRNYSYTDKNLGTGKYNYRLKQIDFNGNFEYFELAEDVIIGIPLKYNLSQNYPNPFNPVTNLEFGIPELGFVSLKIYDVIGRELVTLVNEIKEPGYYKVKFNAADLASGVYFYRMTAGNFTDVKKFVVLK